MGRRMSMQFCFWMLGNNRLISTIKNLTPCFSRWFRHVAPCSAIIGAAIISASDRNSGFNGQAKPFKVVRSGKSLAVISVLIAIIPQPISTPTAAGMIAPLVAMTLPTVAPIPQCTSGITATCLKMKGIDAMLCNCSSALSSTGTPFVQALTGAPLVQYLRQNEVR